MVRKQNLGEAPGVDTSTGGMTGSSPAGSAASTTRTSSENLLVRETELTKR